MTRRSLGPASRLLDAAGGEGPFPDAETLRSRRQEDEPLLGLETVEVAAGLPADGQDVLESRGRDEGDPAALPLEEGVGGDRRAVDDEDRPASVEESPTPSMMARDGSAASRGASC